ncbi:hypothetical protein EDB85DRAFT_1860977 [Lactarius pseudohatsudake]|nr:hypothetical protein EDB85DRAFT_1860977 [Lactarius pseudohatsudake]
MTPLPPFPLPLADQPPDGYGCEERSLSVLSTTTAFKDSIEERDTFLGRPRCIVCGITTRMILQCCYIIGQAEPETWADLRDRHFIPLQSKSQPHHDPRNGLLMCNNHRILFNKFFFFLRFVPSTRRFILVNYSGVSDLQKFHGKAIALDNGNQSPFPSLFIIHEMRARGFRPFAPISPEIPNDNSFQDWITSDGIYDNISHSFRRNLPDNSSSITMSTLPRFPSVTTNTGGSSGVHTLELNADVINEILAATHAMPSWKACEVEGTSWTGTAAENIEKYVSSIGVDEHR